MGLILKLITGIVLGTIAGLMAPELLIQLLVTFKGLFGQLLFFTIPLLILFFITSGIAGLPKRSGRLLGQTLGGAYLSTIVAGVLAATVAILVVPMLTVVSGDVIQSGSEAPQALITLDIPPLMSIMSALVCAFIFGLGIASRQGEVLKSFFDQGRDVIETLLVRVIIPLLPVYIAGVFAELAAQGTVFATLKTFGLILALSVMLHWVWLLVLYGLVGAKIQRNPLSLIRGMLPAYFTALGTMSSAATIPVTLRSVLNNGVDPKVANFSVPLCATTHLSGSTITIVSCAMAVMVLQEGLVMPSLIAMVPFILTLGVVMLAAPGVPGGAVMSAVGLLGSMLGFGETAVALMIALYMAQDSFGTACNVTGDGAIALWVNASQSDQ